MAIGSVILIILFIGVLVGIFFLLRNVVRNIRKIRENENEMLKKLDDVEDENKNEEKLDEN